MLCLCCAHKLIKKVDWQRTVVFSKVATFFVDPFWIAALSFLPKGIGGVFVDIVDTNNKEVGDVHKIWFLQFLNLKKYSVEFHV